MNSCEKSNYTYIIIGALIVFFILLIMAYIYDCTDKFTNFETFKEKINPVNILGIQEYVYDDYTPPELDIPQPTNCVCSFDLDNTLTHGDPTPIINLCIQKGCKLSINTARPSNWVSDIPLEKYGFTMPHFDSRDHYFNKNSYQQTASQVGQVKANYLQLLKDKYRVPSKECVILFDDAEYNLQAAKERGFSIIKAHERGMPGIHPEKTVELMAILNKCN